MVKSDIALNLSLHFYVYRTIFHDNEFLNDVNYTCVLIGFFESIFVPFSFLTEMRVGYFHIKTNILHNIQPEHELFHKTKRTQLIKASLII